MGNKTKIRLTQEQLYFLQQFSVVRSKNKSIYHIPHYFVLDHTNNDDHEMLVTILTMEDLIENSL